ncbi:MAG: aldo/keto reductase [Pseudomonadota bacterium]
MNVAAAGLRNRLQNRLPLAYGVSGPLASPLFSQREVAALISAAKDVGITIFDTSPSYGAGEGERRLGAALVGDDTAFVMTKVGIESVGVLKKQRSFAPPSIRRSVEASLQNLNRDRIDLLWIHGPARSELSDELFLCLDALNTEGKVESFGIVSRDAALQKYADKPPFTAYMAPVGGGTSNTEPLPAETTRFGIECLKGVRAESRMQFGRSDLWRALRSAVRREKTIGAPKLSAKDAFSFAFGKAKCDVILTTTTRKDRLQENAQLCRDVHPSFK